MPWQTLSRDAIAAAEDGKPDNSVHLLGSVANFGAHWVSYEGSGVAQEQHSPHRGGVRKAVGTNDVMLDSRSGEWLFVGSLQDGWRFVEEELGARVSAGPHDEARWRVQTVVPGRDGEAPWSVTTIAVEESLAWRLHIGRLLARGTSPEGVAPGIRLGDWRARN